MVGVNFKFRELQDPELQEGVYNLLISLTTKLRKVKKGENTSPLMVDKRLKYIS